MWVPGRLGGLGRGPGPGPAHPLPPRSDQDHLRPPVQRALLRAGAQRVLPRGVRGGLHRPPADTLLRTWGLRGCPSVRLSPPRMSVCPSVPLRVRPSTRVSVRLRVDGEGPRLRAPGVRMGQSFPWGVGELCPCVRLSVCPSVRVSAALSVRQSACACLSVCPSVFPILLSVCGEGADPRALVSVPSVRLSVHPGVCPWCLSVCPCSPVSFCPPVHPGVLLSVCMPRCLSPVSICLPVHPGVHPQCPSICPCAPVSVRLSAP